MEVTTKGNFIKIKFMVKVIHSLIKDNMFGLKVENIMETGNIIKCMEMEGLNGLTEEFMKDNTFMTKRMVKGLFIGQMVANT